MNSKIFFSVLFGVVLNLTLLSPTNGAQPSPGEILVSEASTKTLRLIATDGSSSSIFSSVAGGPRGIAVETTGDVIVVEVNGNLRRIAADGSSSSVFFGGLSGPSGIAIAANGDLIVTEDAVPHRLWRVTPDGSISHIIASGIKSEDVEIDSDGNFIVLQELNGGQLLKVTPSGTVSVLFSGLTTPSDLAIETSGDFIVAEFRSGTLRRITSDGSSSSVVFTGLSPVEGIAIAPNGDILASEFSLGQLRRIAPDGSSSTIFFTGLNGPDQLVVITSLNASPIADAGPDQTVHPGTLATLDGSASTDPDGNFPLVYSWTITSKPTGSTVSLSGSATVSPTFTPDIWGNYTVELVVTDSLGLSSSSDQVIISPSNTPPAADAGFDQVIIEIGTLVQLGGLSDDPDGDSITYHWGVASKPVESTAIISDPAVSNPTFVADIQGNYVIQLVVTDIFGAASVPDTVMISFNNVSPVAEAGNNRSVGVGDTVFLDGTGSFDVNLDPLTYNWSIVSGPEGNTAVFNDPTLSQATFIPDLAGTYVVGLVVNDGLVNSASDNVTITVITIQDQVTLLLTQAIDVTNLLDNDMFKGKKRKRNLTKKMGQAIVKVDKVEYLEAIEKLNSILNKMDGCAMNGIPDNNDKIITCMAQNQVYPLLMEARGLLLGLI